MEIFNDIIPRSNCTREETVHMPKRITSYEKCCNWYECIMVCGLGVVYLVRQSHVVQNLMHL